MEENMFIILVIFIKIFIFFSIKLFSMFGLDYGIMLVELVFVYFFVRWFSILFENMVILVI